MAGICNMMMMGLPILTGDFESKINVYVTLSNIMIYRHMHITLIGLVVYLLCFLILSFALAICVVSKV